MNLEWRNPPRSFRLNVALSILGIGIWVAERIHGAAFDTLMDDMDMINIDDAYQYAMERI